MDINTNTWRFIVISGSELYYVWDGIFLFLECDLDFESIIINSLLLYSIATEIWDFASCTLFKVSFISLLFVSGFRFCETRSAAAWIHSIYKLQILICGKSLRAQVCSRNPKYSKGRTNCGNSQSSQGKSTNLSKWVRSRHLQSTTSRLGSNTKLKTCHCVS